MRRGAHYPLCHGGKLAQIYTKFFERHKIENVKLSHVGLSAVVLVGEEQGAAVTMKCLFVIFKTPTW